MLSSIQNKGGLGTLLRLIIEERKASPHYIPQGTEPATPMREAIATPLEAPKLAESRGSLRRIAIRPEDKLIPESSQGVSVLGSARMGSIGGTNKIGQILSPRVLTEAELKPITLAKSRPSLQDYLNQGKTKAQWIAETGQLGTYKEPNSVQTTPVNTSTEVEKSAPIQIQQRGSVLGTKVYPTAPPLSSGQYGITPQNQQLFSDIDKTFQRIQQIIRELNAQNAKERETFRWFR